MNKNSRTLRRKFFQKKIPIYRKNPVLFAQEVLLFEPDDWQKQALMDLAESPKVAIKSGQGVGKTGMEAVALLWQVDEQVSFALRHPQMDEDLYLYGWQRKALVCRS
mgnify:CR=1 FL=1